MPGAVLGSLGCEGAEAGGCGNGRGHDRSGEHHRGWRERHREPGEGRGRFEWRLGERREVSDSAGVLGTHTTTGWGLGRPRRDIFFILLQILFFLPVLYDDTVY